MPDFTWTFLYCCPVFLYFFLLYFYTVPSSDGVISMKLLGTISSCVACRPWNTTKNFSKWNFQHVLDTVSSSWSSCCTVFCWKDCRQSWPYRMSYTDQSVHLIILDYYKKNYLRSPTNLLCQTGVGYKQVRFEYECEYENMHIFIRSSVHNFFVLHFIAIIFILCRWDHHGVWFV